MPLHRSTRIGLFTLLGAALVSAPWETLSVVALLYALSIPFSIAAYARVKRRRVAEAAAEPPKVTIGPAS